MRDLINNRNQTVRIVVGQFDSVINNIIYTVCILFGVKGFFELLFFSFVKSILEKLPPWTS